MEFKFILYKKSEGVATITINRPEALNAFNADVIREILQALEDVKADENVRVVILTGAGEKAFSAGADIKAMKGMNALKARELSQLGEKLCSALENLEKPVIAAINGYALGGGLEVAMACDIRIASENAKMGQTEINIGLIPGWGGTQRLTRLIGMTKAKELIFTGKMTDAKTAEHLGLVNMVVPQGSFREAVRQFALELAQKAPVALKVAKADDVQNVAKYKLFNPVLQQIYESSLEYGKKLHLIVVGTIIYPKFMKFIRDDVEFRYRFKPILFEFYDPAEIEAILRQRLDIINIPYEEAAIKFVSAKIKRLIADLRLGFDILKNACEITKGGKITEAVIEQAWERTKTDYWKQQIRHMDEHLCILLLGASLAAQNSPDQVVSAQQILDYYRQYCWHNGIEPLYKTRLSYAFKKLDELGWLTRLTKFSKGRYGLDISYKYENNPTTIIAALKELAYDPSTLEQTTVADATQKPALNTEKPQPQKSYVA